MSIKEIHDELGPFYLQNHRQACFFLSFSTMTTKFDPRNLYKISTILLAIIIVSKLRTVRI